MTASLASTSEHPALLQSCLPAIDSKTFTDWGSLLLLSRIRTVPLPPDSVKRWAHFHRDGSLGAWSCLMNIIAQVFVFVKWVSISKWVWETDFENFLWTIFQSGVCNLRLIDLFSPRLHHGRAAFYGSTIVPLLLLRVMQMPPAYQCSWICRTNRWIAARQQRDVPDRNYELVKLHGLFFSLY